MFRSNKGWACWSPAEPDLAKLYKPLDPSPRVFYSRKSASSAIAGWMTGPTYYPESEDFGYDNRRKRNPQFAKREKPLLQIINATLQIP